MKKLSYIVSVLLVSISMTLLSGQFLGKTYAAPCNDFNKTILGIPTWYKYLEGEEIAGKCKPIINASVDTLPIGLAVLEAAITLGGVVAAALVFVGGFKYVLAQGEPDKAANARKTVINAMIGLVIVIVATRVVSFIANRLT